VKYGKIKAVTGRFIAVSDRPNDPNGLIASLLIDLFFGRIIQMK
jgi:hypothetical protein